jgi:hypothetical protein
MPETRNRPGAGVPEAASDLVDATTTSVGQLPDADYLLAWAAGYTAGYDRGHEAGYAEGHTAGMWAYDAELVDALKFALGGSTQISRREAVRRHHRLVDQKARRDAFDSAGREVA